MLLGYARVSTPDQDLSLQIDALNAANCERIFSDVSSGAKAARPGLDKLLDHARAGDTIIVWRLDRLGRSLKHLIDTVNLLNERGVNFRSLQESLDTATAGGRLIFHIFGAIAEFERELIRERTNAGLRAARAKGKYGGRKLIPEKKIQLAMSLAESNPDISIEEVCKSVGITVPTYYRRTKALPSEK